MSFRVINCSLGNKSGIYLENICLNETIKKVKVCENKISDNILGHLFLYLKQIIQLKIRYY